METDPDSDLSHQQAISHSRLIRVACAIAAERRPYKVACRPRDSRPSERKRPIHVTKPSGRHWPLAPRRLGLIATSVNYPLSRQLKSRRLDGNDRSVEEIVIQRLYPLIRIDDISPSAEYIFFFFYHESRVFDCLTRC